MAHVLYFASGQAMLQVLLHEEVATSFASSRHDPQIILAFRGGKSFWCRAKQLNQMLLMRIWLMGVPVGDPRVKCSSLTVFHCMLLSGKVSSTSSGVKDGIPG